MAVSYWKTPASGDIRHFIKTVNALPDDYSGNLTVVINDQAPIVCLRNLVLLILLGTIEDPSVAAELSLHLWYSAFTQMGHPLMVISTIAPLIPTFSNPKFSIELGSTSRLSGALSSDTVTLLGIMLQANADVSTTQAEMDRVLYGHFLSL